MNIIHILALVLVALIIVILLSLEDFRKYYLSAKLSGKVIECRPIHSEDGSCRVTYVVESEEQKLKYEDAFPRTNLTEGQKFDLVVWGASDRIVVQVSTNTLMILIGNFLVRFSIGIGIIMLLAYSAATAQDTHFL